ncbi:hypothetical protein N6H14_02735 [Paenibacillus sp. CC-CFT747]|nr:hypothetical protein N6H14_02735 [Paenibacillus sp. CC-CFT747]
MFGLMPVAVSSVVHLVRAVLYGEEGTSIGELLKKSFRRFGALLGSSLLFGLCMLGIYLAVVIGIVIVAVVLGTAGNLLGSSGGIGAAVLFMFLIFAALSIGIFFFTIRWGYYLPSVALGKKRPDSAGAGD